MTKQREGPKKEAEAEPENALQRLAGGIAHDFRNVLAVIKGNIDAAAMYVNDPRVAGRLRDASQAAELGAAMTDKLFAFAKRNADPIELIDVAAALAGVEPLLRATAGDDLEVIMNYPEDAGRIRASKTGFQSSLINLVANARDATDSGGTIAIEAAVVEVSESIGMLSGDLAPGQYVRLDVSDTGNGMTASVRSRALDPFFTTKGGGGFGLGLALVHRFAHECDGGINIESIVGDGCKAVLYLRAR
jgi:signal transduction histidine kinase